MPSRSAAVGLLVAHAVAFAALAHAHYVVRPPSRLEWALLELAIASALWPACRRYTRFICDSLTARAAVVPVLLGVFVSRWWAGTLHDTLWLFPAAARPALGVALAVSHAVVLAAVYAGLLAAVARTDPVVTPITPPN